VNDGYGVKLQATLAAANPPTDLAFNVPHHPIACREDRLWLDPDGRMGCEHGQVPAGDPRTQACLDHSVAILLIELLREKEDADVGHE
jgi:hypothetical protein